MDLQGLGIVALDLTDLARHVHIGQEVHLNFDDALPFAGLAPSSLHIKREAARLVAAYARLGYLGKEFTDAGERSGIGRRIGAWCAPNRRLIDIDYLVQVLHTLNGIMRPC